MNYLDICPSLPTIALYHNGVEAVVSSVPFFLSRRHMFGFCFFSSYPILV